MTLPIARIVPALLCTVPALTAVITLDGILGSGYTRARLLVLFEEPSALGTVGPRWWFLVTTVGFLFVLGVVSFVGRRRAAERTARAAWDRLEGSDRR